MAADRQKPSLVVIVGPTASGKSRLAMKLARQFNGEIITADSRTIYKGMDIGAAKPTKADQRAVKHWGLDLIEPGQRFSAKQFKDYADQAVNDIQKRGKLPIMVGGSGLYVDAVLYNYTFEAQNGKDPQNPRHRLKNSYAKDIKIMSGICLVGLALPIEQLRSNINSRSDKMFAQGVVNETNKLMLKYGKNSLLKTAGIVYKACVGYLAGSYDLDHAKELNELKEWQFARRQRTWFKRNKNIKWFANNTQAYKYINSCLNK